MNRRLASWSARVPANGAEPGGAGVPVPDITDPEIPAADIPAADIPAAAGWARRPFALIRWVRTALAAARMWAGVVPQQPPTRDTPASANRRK
jgi:hypothetical protein